MYDEYPSKRVLVSDKFISILVLRPFAGAPCSRFEVSFTELDFKFVDKKVNETITVKIISSDNKGLIVKPENTDTNILIKKSDIIIVSTPHKAYKKLKISKNKILVDIWGLIDKK